MLFMFVDLKDLWFYWETVGAPSPSSSNMATMEITTEDPQKTNKRLSYDPAVLFLSTYQKKGKSAYNTDTCISMCITGLVTIAKLQNQLRSIHLHMNG
jgi:hypothetical protein